MSTMTESFTDPKWQIVTPEMASKEWISSIGYDLVVLAFLRKFSKHLVMSKHHSQVHPTRKLSSISSGQEGFLKL